MMTGPETKQAAPDDSDVFTLHRYYIWANRMRAHLDELMVKKPDYEDAQVEILMYMSLWYASLYVVVEGWRELGLEDPQIDELLKSPHLTFCGGTETACTTSSGAISTRE